MTLLREPLNGVSEGRPDTCCGVSKGKCASTGVTAGTARIVKSREDAERVQDGDVVIVPDTSPAWSSLFDKAAAIIAERGGELSSLAIAARENGTPLALCVKNATEIIPDGSYVTVNATAGKVRWHSSDHHTPYLCDLRQAIN